MVDVKYQVHSRLPRLDENPQPHVRVKDPLSICPRYFATPGIQTWLVPHFDPFSHGLLCSKLSSSSCPKLEEATTSSTVTTTSWALTVRGQRFRSPNPLCHASTSHSCLTHRHVVFRDTQQSGTLLSNKCLRYPPLNIKEHG